MTAQPTNPLELGLPEVLVKKPGDDDIRLWSVTTIIGVLDKPGLLYWAAAQAAKAAVDISKSLPARLAEDGEENVVKWLRDARFRRPKNQLSDAEFGTQIHHLCEQYALTGIKPEVRDDVFLTDIQAARDCFDRFDEWLQAFQPTYQATEVVVYSPEYGYAGTSDAFLTIDGVPLIVDYKASKKSVGADGKPSPIYSETALQLAGYRYADLAAVWQPRRFESFRRRYYLLSHGEQEMAVPVPKVEGGLGIKITPQSCLAYPVRCDERVFDAFLYCLDCAKWVLQDSKDAVGEPLTPPAKGA